DAITGRSSASTNQDGIRGDDSGGGGAGGGAAVGHREADAGGGHGHGVVPAGARGHQGRRAGGHRGGVPPLRHRLHVRHGEAARRGRGRGGAARAPRVPGGGVRHLQALVHAEPPGPRDPVPPGDPQEPADGVRGSVPDPLASRPQARTADVPQQEDAVPLDIEGVWRAMEECQQLGLAKAIGVSNFTTKHLDKLLANAKIPPAVNQVELNPVWQQRTLRTYCAEKGIHVAAYSPLGGQNWDGTGHNAVMASEVLAEIAKAKGKTVAQENCSMAPRCALVDHVFSHYTSLASVSLGVAVEEFGIPAE
ncbi:unnamed protein product, partial [Urochloa humidicola]